MKRLEQWQLDYIREHKNDYPRRLIAEVVGLSLSTVYCYIHKFGGATFCGKSNEATRKAISETRKKIFRSERRMMMAGEAQRTKLKINLLPRNTQYVVARLKNRHAYFHADGDPFLTLCYDHETHRTPNEAHFTQKYGIKFVPADGI